MERLEVEKLTKVDDFLSSLPSKATMSARLSGRYHKMFCKEKIRRIICVLVVTPSVRAIRSLLRHSNSKCREH